MRAESILVIAGGLGALSCEVTATQVVVEVGSDLVPADGEISGFRVRVLGPDGAVAHDETFDLVGPDAVALPASFGVAPVDGDPARRVTVEARALLGADELFTTTATTRFVEHRAMRLEMFLARRCRTEARYCPQGQTCSADGCVPVAVDERDDVHGGGGGLGPIPDWVTSLPFAAAPGSNAFPQIASDRSGNVFLAGMARGAITFVDEPEGLDDVYYGFVVALDAFGNVRWRQVVAPTEETTLLSVLNVVVDDDGVHVAGDVSGGANLGEDVLSAPGAPPTLFVARFDPETGAPTLDTFVSDAPIDVLDFEGSPTGLALAGTFVGHVELDAPYDNPVPDSAQGFVALLDGQHEVLWSCALPPQATPLAVAAGPDDALVIGASYQGTLYGQLSPFGANQLVAEVDRDCANALWVHRPERAGSPFWHVNDLALGSDGRTVIVGDAAGPIQLSGGEVLTGVGDVDALLEVLDGGDAVHGFLAGGPAQGDATLAVALDAIGRVAVAGVTTAPIDLGLATDPFGGDVDAFVAGVGPDGTALWTWTFGGAAADNASDVALDRATGAVLVTGVAHGRVDSLDLEPGIYVKHFVP